jgi:hypothetical protein
LEVVGGHVIAVDVLDLGRAAEIVERDCIYNPVAIRLPDDRARTEIRVARIIAAGFPRAIVVGEIIHPANGVVQRVAIVAVMQDATVGVNHLSHLAADAWIGIRVLHFRRGGRIHRAAGGLVLADQLAEAIVLILRLVHDIIGTVVAGFLERIAQVVVAVGELYNRSVDVFRVAGSDGCGIAGLAAQGVIRVGVVRAVLVGHRQLIAQRVVGVFDIVAGRRTGVAGAGIGVFDRRQQVVAVDGAAAGRGDAINVRGGLECVIRQHRRLRQDVVVAIIGVGGRLVAVVGRRAVGVVGDGFGGAAEGIVKGAGVDAAGIDYILGQALGVVTRRRDQRVAVSDRFQDLFHYH